jgi:iron uptake system EfeUOB component EfeO/EfeM
LESQDKDTKYDRNNRSRPEKVPTLDKNKNKNKNKNKQKVIKTTFSHKDDIINLITKYYPTNIGRTVATNKLLGTCKLKNNRDMKLIKTKEDLSLLEKAIKNYSKYVAENGKEQYVQNAANFVEGWEDWLAWQSSAKPKLKSFY